MESQNKKIKSFKDVTTIQDALELIKQSMATEVTKNKINYETKSIDELKQIYEKEYNGFKQNPFFNKQTGYNFFEGFFHASKGILTQNFQVNEEGFKKLKIDNEIVQNYKYEMFRRENIDDYELAKQYNARLIKIGQTINDAQLQKEKIKDQISTANLFKNAYKSLTDMFNFYSNQIYAKVTTVIRTNNNAAKHTEKRLQMIRNFNYYYNSIQNREVPPSEVESISQFIKTQFKDDLLLSRVSLTPSNILSRKFVLLNSRKIGGVVHTIFYSFKINKGLSFKQKVKFSVYDLLLCLKTKNKVRKDIKSNNMEKLIKDLNEFENYSIATAKRDKICNLYLYAMMSQYSTLLFKEIITNHNIK